MDEGGQSTNKVDGFLLIIDECGKIIYVSESAVSHLGFSYLDLSGYSWFSLVHPDDQVASRTHFKDAIAKCLHAVNANQTAASSPHSSPASAPSSSSLNAPDLPDPNPADAEGGNRPGLRPPALPSRCQCSSLTVRVLQGQRRRTDSMSSVGSPSPSRRPSGPPTISRSISAPAEIVRQVPTTGRREGERLTESPGEHVYRMFHFSGIVRPLKMDKEADQNGRQSIVWVAVARPVVSSSPSEQLEPVSSSAMHFVIRHDVNGFITSADERCRQFIGYAPDKLVNSCLFDHLPAEDIPFLKYQYEQLFSHKSESIAITCRFRTAVESSGEPSPDGERASAQSAYTYLNCRAYLALNPSTFHMDEIVTLAAPMRTSDGEAEFAKQSTRLSTLVSRKWDHPPTVVTKCALEALQPKQRSPLHSPDSNTREREPPSNPPSTSPDTWTNRTREMEQVGVDFIDSQCSPSKLSELESQGSSGGPGGLNVSPRSAGTNGSGTSPQGVTEAPGEGGGGTVGDTGGDTGTVEKRSVAAVQSDQPGRRGSTPLYDDHKELASALNRISQNVLDERAEDRGMVRSVFHEQLRDKHRFLERSIAHQQQQLHQLQMRLMALVNENAASISASPQSPMPVPAPLQRPLHKVMELQARLMSHKEQTHVQRARMEEVQMRLQNESHFHGSAMKNNGILNGNHPIHHTVSAPNLPGLDYNGRVTPRNNVAASPRHVHNVASDDQQRSSGAVSPPFVDMSGAKSAEPTHADSAPLNGPAAPHPAGDLLSQPELGFGEGMQSALDFEEGLLELENLLKFDFDFPRTLTSGTE